MNNTTTNKNKLSILDKLRGIFAIPAVRIIFILFVSGIVLVAPQIVNLYILRVLILMGFYMVLALSLNLITGYLGEVSLGHAAFYAVGAYTAVLLVKDAGWSYETAVLASVALTGFLGFLLALATMRVSGTYQCVLTIAFFYLTMSVILNWADVTHGAYGINGINPARLFGVSFDMQNKGYYYCVFAYVALAVLISYLLINSRYGRAIKAYREDALASTMVGINNQTYRRLVYTISGALAGLAGSLYGPFLGWLDPKTFTYDMCLMTLLMVLVGGRGTIGGVLVGCMIISPLGEVLRKITDLMKGSPINFIRDPDQWRFVIYGIILVVIMRVRPQGLLGGLDKSDYRFQRGVKLPNKEASEHGTAGN